MDRTLRGEQKPPPDGSPFRLGDLVMCRYSMYPYWPATIDQTHQEKMKGKYWCRRRTRGGEEVLAFWCTFSNEDTGGWVRFDRMVRYHPDIVDRIRLDTGDEYYEEQKNALEVASKAYGSLPLPGRQGPPDQLPRDYSGKSKREADDDESLQSDTSDDEDEMDIGVSDSEEDEYAKMARHTPSRRGGARAHPSRGRGGRGRGRPRKEGEPRMDDGRKLVNKRKSTGALPTPGRERKRKRVSEPVERSVEGQENGSSALAGVERNGRVHASDVSSTQVQMLKQREESLKADLSAARKAIASLRAEIEAKDERIADLTKSDKSVRFQSPSPPQNIKFEMPKSEEYGSSAVDSDEFAEVMKALGDCFRAFKRDVKEAEASRSNLEKAQERMSTEYAESFKRVEDAESKAVVEEKALLGTLSKLLTFKVEVADLRSHRAGNVVRAMGKTCKQIPSIARICNEIYDYWKGQVLKYLETEDGKKLSASTEGDKQGSNPVDDAKADEDKQSKPRSGEEEGDAEDSARDEDKDKLEHGEEPRKSGRLSEKKSQRTEPEKGSEKVQKEEDEKVKTEDKMDEGKLEKDGVQQVGEGKRSSRSRDKEKPKDSESKEEGSRETSGRDTDTKNSGASHALKAGGSQTTAGVGASPKESMGKEGKATSAKGIGSGSPTGASPKNGAEGGSTADGVKAKESEDADKMEEAAEEDGAESSKQDKGTEVEKEDRCSRRKGRSERIERAREEGRTRTKSEGKSDADGDRMEVDSGEGNGMGKEEEEEGAVGEGSKRGIGRKRSLASREEEKQGEEGSKQKRREVNKVGEKKEKVSEVTAAS